MICEALEKLALHDFFRILGITLQLYNLQANMTRNLYFLICKMQIALCFLEILQIALCKICDFDSYPIRHILGHQNRY